MGKFLADNGWSGKLLGLPHNPANTKLGQKINRVIVIRFIMCFMVLHSKWVCVLKV